MGADFFVRGPVIPGGIIPNSIKNLPFPDIPRLVIFLPKKYARILAPLQSNRKIQSGFDTSSYSLISFC